MSRDTADGMATWFRPDPTRWRPHDPVGSSLGVLAVLVLHNEEFACAVEVIEERLRKIEIEAEPAWDIRTAVFELWGRGRYDDNGKTILGPSGTEGRPPSSTTLAAISLLVEYKTPRLKQNVHYSAAEVIAEERKDIADAVKRAEKRIEQRVRATPRIPPSSG